MSTDNKYLDIGYLIYANTDWQDPKNDWGSAGKCMPCFNSKQIMHPWKQCPRSFKGKNQ